MLKIVISPRARRDLKDIWKYTLKEWGEAQAEKYLENLDREIYRLLEFADIGVPYEHIRKGYRALHVEHHLVFYRRKSNTLDIMRVLHEAMKVKSHL